MGLKVFFKKIVLALIVFSLVGSANAEEAIEKKIESLQKEIEALKKQLQDHQKRIEKTENTNISKWFTLGGDYRFRVDVLRADMPNYWQFNPVNPFVPIPMAKQTVENDSLYTNRFGLNLKIKATQDVSVTARLVMNKVSGAQDSSAVLGPFFADRVGLFDGTVGHIPNDNTLYVDTAYATWSNILGQPIWFSVGRRPSTGGIPTHLKQNAPKPDVSGTPALLVDYAFDGMTLGYAPDIDALPGAYLKICYGRGFESGFQTATNSLDDTDMFGVQVVPYDTEKLTVFLQWNRGMNIFDAPVMKEVYPGFPTGPTTTSLGNIDWYGLNLLGKIKKVGIGNLNWFISTAASVTDPHEKSGPFGTGLLLNPTENKDSKTGYAIYLGGRYDIESTGTKIGLEYNHGTKNWITFAPAADDIWTSKLGTRGNVYEAYIIQEIKQKAISSFNAKAFFKLGYQYYQFDYTGSNNWVGAPVDIDALDNPANAQMMSPLEKATNVYATFEVHF